MVTRIHIKIYLKWIQVLLPGAFVICLFACYFLTYFYLFVFVVLLFGGRFVYYLLFCFCFLDVVGLGCC